METFILILIIAAGLILLISMSALSAALGNIEQASHKKTSADILKKESTEVEVT